MSVNNSNTVKAMQAAVAFAERALADALFLHNRAQNSYVLTTSGDTQAELIALRMAVEAEVRAIDELTKCRRMLWAEVDSRNAAMRQQAAS